MEKVISALTKLSARQPKIKKQAQYFTPFGLWKKQFFWWLFAICFSSFIQNGFSLKKDSTKNVTAGKKFCFSKTYCFSIALLRNIKFSKQKFDCINSLFHLFLETKIFQANYPFERLKIFGFLLLIVFIPLTIKTLLIRWILFHLCFEYFMPSIFYSRCKNCFCKMVKIVYYLVSHFIYVKKFSKNLPYNDHY